MALLLIKRMSAILFVQFLTINLLGQSTANATISASIIDLVGTISSSYINFNNFSFASNPGTLNLNSKSINGKSSFIPTGKFTQAFSFDIIGSNYTYAITLPSSSVVLKNKIGNEIIQSDMFNIILPINEQDKYNQTVSISATLTIPPIQAPGYYTSINPLLFTVHYN